MLIQQSSTHQDLGRLRLEFRLLSTSWLLVVEQGQEALEVLVAVLVDSVLALVYL